MTTSRAPPRRPAIYTKLLDVDKVDLLFAPYATVPTAPIMPLVKQRGLLLMGNFSFQVNSKVGHDMWFNNAPWGPADSWAASFLDLGQKAGGKTIALLAADQEFAQNLALTARGCRQEAQHASRLRPDLSAEHGRLLVASSARSRPPSPTSSIVASYPPDSAGILRAVNEIGVGDNVKIFGGGMVGLQFAAVMEPGLAAQRRRQLQLLAAGTEHVSRRHQGVLRAPTRSAPSRPRSTRSATTCRRSATPSARCSSRRSTRPRALDQKALADYLRKNELKTIVGPIRSAAGRRVGGNPRVVQAQFRGVVDKNIEQFRTAGQAGDPVSRTNKTGDVISPSRPRDK